MRSAGRQLWVVLVAFCCGCAEMAAPPGGPVDEVAPELVALFPENGATNVPLETTLTALFSERIAKAESAFEMTPDPEDLSVSIRGRRVVVKARLEAEQTYTARFSDLLTDNHGVKLAAPVEWAFSTGSEIDSGRLAGRVVKGVAAGEPVEGAVVVLLPLAVTADPLEEELRDEGPLHWIQPAYHRRTDADGRWALEHLPAGRWRVLAVDDANGNGRVEPGRERHAAFWRPVATDDSTAIELLLVDPQERPTEIVDGRMPHQGLIDLRLDRRVAADAQLEARISPAGRVRAVIPAGFHIYVQADSIAEGLLEVSIRGLPDGTPPRAEPPSIEFRAGLDVDARPPRVVAATTDSTAGEVPLSGELFLVFNEPLLPGGAADSSSLVMFVPADSSLAPQEPLDAELATPALLRARFALPESISVAGTIVPGAGTVLTDAAGNAARFEVPARLPARADAVSLVGTVSAWPAVAGEHRVTVGRAGRTVADATCDAAGGFSFAALPAGRLTLAAYVDRNGNHCWDGADPRTGRGGEPAVTTQVEAEKGQAISEMQIGFQ